jgi:hypothetical protein
MAKIIADQNRDIQKAFDHHTGWFPTNNVELCKQLGIAEAPKEYQQEYAVSDLKVKVI